MNDLKDKVILLTGGAGVIGSTLVKELLIRGVKGVAIVDVSQELGEKVLEKVADKRAIFIKTDITNSDELEDAFKKTVETYKQLDLVINNAALMNEVQWKKAVSVNLTALIEATYLAMRKYLPEFKSGDEGVIVNVASLLGFDFLETVPVYCATKHAVVGFGKCVGTDLFYNTYKVRVLTLCPAAVNTALITSVDKDRFLFPERMVQELEVLKETIQTPKNVAKAVIDVVNEGKHGSIWIVQNNEPAYEVRIPTGESLVKY